MREIEESIKRLRDCLRAKITKTKQLAKQRSEIDYARLSKKKDRNQLSYLEHEDLKNAKEKQSNLGTHSQSHIYAHIINIRRLLTTNEISLDVNCAQHHNYAKQKH